MTKVLLLEDDKKLAASLLKLFNMEGFFVSHLETLGDLETQIKQSEKFDIIILDRIVHGLDSKMMVAKIRNYWPRTAILILSAINTSDERADLINMGVDDYLGKPFSVNELLARIKSLSRKYQFAGSGYTILGNTTIDLMKRTVAAGSDQEILPAKEFLVLKALSSISGKVCNRAELLESVWGSNFQIETNVVESTIANLRKKLSNIKSDIKIKNSRNSGYWIEI